MNRNPFVILFGIGILSTVIALILISPASPAENETLVTSAQSPTIGITEVTVTFSQIYLANLVDCDGESCDTIGEVYGYIAVNDQKFSFGPNPPAPLLLRNGETYNFRPMLGVFGIRNEITIPAMRGEWMTVEIILFDQDEADQVDDLFCMWQETMFVPEPATWEHGQNSQTLIGGAIRGESDCEFTILLLVT